MEYDALLFVSFGGPEGPDDVMPFLENVTRGRNIPKERLEQVAQHYMRFGGVSPINGQNRKLIAALEECFKSKKLDLPIYWGNRNWHPMLTDTLQQMKDDGVKRALAFVTAAYGSYSGCRQYLDDIETARNAVGEAAPEIHKLRLFYNHPLFIETNADNLNAALMKAERNPRIVLFTAHSVPLSMAENCSYENQLREAARLTAQRCGDPEWKLVYQSRSGPPQQPWLGPDVCEEIERLANGGYKDVVILPIGFVSDHMEVVFDLDVQARELCESHGINLYRADTVGTHEKFVQMIFELVQERLIGIEQRSLGEHSLPPDFCAVDCCKPAAVTGGRQKP